MAGEYHGGAGAVPPRAPRIGDELTVLELFSVRRLSVSSKIIRIIQVTKQPWRLGGFAEAGPGIGDGVPGGGGLRRGGMFMAADQVAG